VVDPPSGLEAFLEVFFRSPGCLPPSLTHFFFSLNQESRVVQKITDFGSEVLTDPPGLKEEIFVACEDALNSLNSLPFLGTSALKVQFF